MTGTVIAILGVAVAALGLFLAARQQGNEMKRQRQQAINDAVAAATQPLAAEVTRLQQRLWDRERRIEQLEDELRRPQ